MGHERRRCGEIDVVGLSLTRSPHSLTQRRFTPARMHIVEDWDAGYDDLMEISLGGPTNETATESKRFCRWTSSNTPGPQLSTQKKLWRQFLRPRLINKSMSLWWQTVQNHLLNKMMSLSRMMSGKRPSC
jgi:hypothetical protein